jgi:uncharacterized protein (TIGR02217 family)
MELLDLGFDYGAISTLRFETNITVQSNGMEQRNIAHSQARVAIQLGNRKIRRWIREMIQDLHDSVYGSEQEFKIRDWTDYTLDREHFGTGDGVTTAFQLCKRYTIDGVSVRRPIVAPDRVSILGGGSYSLADHGVVTFAVPPAVGVKLYCSGRFDVVVRFDSDQLPLRFDYARCDEDIYTMESVQMIECKKPSLPVFDPVVSDLDTEIDLGFDYGTVGGNEFSTDITTLQGGFERRDRNWETPRGRWNIGQRGLTDSEKNHLVSLFRVCRGAGCTFRYYSHARNESARVRFESDEMSIQYVVTDGCASLYQFQGVPLVEVPAFFPLLG